MPYSFKQRVVLVLRLLRHGETPRPARREVPPISAEEIAEARAFFPLDKFFIFGHARSGTTMLARLIRLHPEVHCNYQAHFFTRSPLLESLVVEPEVGEWLSRGSNRWNHGRDLSPLVLRAAADFILEREARREGKRIVGDKSPSSLLDGEAVRLMHKVYPDARLIYIVRDGRDTAVSHRFQSFIEFPERLSKDDQQLRARFARDPQPFLAGEQSIFTQAAILRAAQGWVRNVTQTDQQGKALFGERYLSLRYEDLLHQPWEQMSRVWDFLGAVPGGEELHQALAAEMTQNPDADWQQQKARDIAASLQKGKRGSWRELFTARDRQIFRQIADETLLAWGYEATS
jgi:hypothetical protein